MGESNSSNSGQKPSGRNNRTHKSARGSTDNSGNETERMYDTECSTMRSNAKHILRTGRRNDGCRRFSHQNFDTDQ